jgi:hypothetical protein
LDSTAHCSLLDAAIRKRLSNAEIYSCIFIRVGSECVLNARIDCWFLNVVSCLLFIDFDTSPNAHDHFPGVSAQKSKGILIALWIARHMRREFLDIWNSSPPPHSLLYYSPRWTTYHVGVKPVSVRWSESK